MVNPTSITTRITTERGSVTSMATRAARPPGMGAVIQTRIGSMKIKATTHTIRKKPAARTRCLRKASTW